MAAKTPVTDKSTAGYVIPEQTVYGGVNAATDNLLSDVGQHHANVHGLKNSRFYFGPSNSDNDIDSGDTWASGIPGIVAVAWQPADPTDDLVGPTLLQQDGGIVGFVATNTNNEGWLWVLHSR